MRNDIFSKEDLQVTVELTKDVACENEDTIVQHKLQFTDRKSFTTDEIDSLKKIKLSEMVIGEPYPGSGNADDPNDRFEVLLQKQPEYKVVFSNRDPSQGELRGWRLRDLLEHAKVENPEQSVFDALSNHVNRLQWHSSSVRWRTFMINEYQLNPLCFDLFYQWLYEAQKNGREFDFKNQPDVACEYLHNAYAKFSQLQELLEQVEEKSTLLLSQNKQAEHLQVESLLMGIKARLNEFIDTRINAKECQDGCKPSIQAAKNSCLNEYTLWQKILSTLEYILVSVFTSCGLGNWVSKQHDGKYAFFNVQSELDQVEDSIAMSLQI